MGSQIIYLIYMQNKGCHLVTNNGWYVIKPNQKQNYFMILSILAYTDNF